MSALLTQQYLSTEVSKLSMKEKYNLDMLREMLQAEYTYQFIPLVLLLISFVLVGGLLFELVKATPN